MKNIFYFVIFAVSFSISVLAQTPTPSPTPVSKESDVVKISTNLVQVDVTVTDLNGKVINDIKPEEMEIYENGKKQPISNFSFISNVKKTVDPVKNTPGKIGVPVPPTILRPEQVHRTIALVVDDLTLSFESTYYVRRALKKFVDEQMQDGDLVAIIRTGAGIGALQQFTSDKRMLYAAIEKVRWNALGNGKIGAFAPLQGIPVATNDEEKKQAEELKQMDKEMNDFRESVFATGTLGAINYVVRGMQGLPGRKSIMLLSDGFTLFTKDDKGFMDSSRVMASINLLIDAANRASVVINTMDARGLVYTGFTASDDTSGHSRDDLSAEVSDRNDKLLDTQDGLLYLARQTGGKSLINNNDLSGEIRKILDDQSYYLVGYQPDDETFDPVKHRFNRIEVKVNRKDVKVRYRSGFFGVTDEKLTAGSTSVQTPQQQIMNALMSPFSVNDISVHLDVIFADDAKEGPYIKPLLHIDGKDLKFTDEPDGTKKAVFDIVGVIYGDNGQVVDQIFRTYTFTPKPDAYQRILENGFVYYLNFPIKKPGAYQFRLAIRDNQTTKVGSANQFIEVPNLKKNNLILSSIVLDKITPDQLKNGAADFTTNSNSVMSDVAQRRFKKGVILRYGVEIYNAQHDQAKKAQLQTQVRIFRDGKIVLDGKPALLNLEGQANLAKTNFVGALSLGGDLQSGDYVMQIIVTDDLAREKNKQATQWIQFEVTE